MPPDHRITLECKRKERTLTHKESCSLSREQCEEILAGSFPQPREDQPLLRSSMPSLPRTSLRPKSSWPMSARLCVPAGNVRITFDRNIGFTSSDVSRFFDRELPLRRCCPQDAMCWK